MDCITHLTQKLLLLLRCGCIIHNHSVSQSSLGGHNRHLSAGSFISCSLSNSSGRFIYVSVQGISKINIADTALLIYWTSTCPQPNLSPLACPDAHPSPRLVPCSFLLPQSPHLFPLPLFLRTSRAASGAALEMLKRASPALSNAPSNKLTSFPSGPIREGREHLDARLSDC